MKQAKKKVTRNGSPIFSTFQAFLPVLYPGRLGSKEGGPLVSILHLLFYSLVTSMSRHSSLNHFSMWFPKFKLCKAISL